MPSTTCTHGIFAPGPGYCKSNQPYLILTQTNTNHFVHTGGHQCKKLRDYRSGDDRGNATASGELQVDGDHDCFCFPSDSG